MQLIKQRTQYDCWIACAAMLTGLTYDYLLEKVKDEYVPTKGGVRHDSAALELLGYTFDFENDGNNQFIHTGTTRKLYRPFEMSSEYFRQQIWGRRALVSVPSLNYEGKFHAVYWHYDKIYDPSPLRVYTSFTELHPTDLTVFQEGVGR